MEISTCDIDLNILNLAVTEMDRDNKAQKSVRFIDISIHFAFFFLNLE